MPRSLTEQRESNKMRHRARRQWVIHVLFGGQCHHCDETDPRVLQIDHLVPPMEDYEEPGRSGSSLVTALYMGRKDAGDFQLLCANCNQIKKVERGEVKGYRMPKAKRQALLRCAKGSGSSHE